MVAPGGVITVVCYTKHAGGLEEYEAVRSLASGLSPSYWVTTETRLLNRPSAPTLVVVHRHADGPPGAGWARAKGPSGVMRPRRAMTARMRQHTTIGLNSAGLE